MPAIDALNAVNERTRRFIAASGCLGRTDYLPDPGIDYWPFKQWSHPLDGWAMAYGYGPRAFAHAPDGAPEARLAFGAVRTGAGAASIEVTAGLELYYDGDGRHLHRSLHRPGLAGPGELIPSWETAPPDVVELRTFPRLGCVNRIMLPFWRELPDLHWEAGHPEVDEVSLSARSSAFGAGSKMVVGLPWCSREHELFYELDMENAHAALQAVRAAIAPAPAGGRLNARLARRLYATLRAAAGLLTARPPCGAPRADQSATVRDSTREGGQRGEGRVLAAV